MGFSIGALISGLSPLVGSIIGGPGGAAFGQIGGAIGASLARPSLAVLRSSPPPAAVPFPPRSSFDFSQAAAGRVPFSRLLPPLLLPGPGQPSGARTRLQSILDDASSAAGKRVTSKDVVNAAKVCGLETAASSFGVSVEDICFVVVHGMRRRRRRGISAADLRRTRSTIRKISNMRRDLKRLK